MQSWHRRAAARLDHLKFSNDGIPIDGLREPENPVGNRKDRIALLFLCVLAKEEGGCFPSCEMKCETLNESIQIERRIPSGGTSLATDRSEGIDDDNSGFGTLDFA